jgi:4-hydroxybenzoate polyprenyltransferase
MKGLLKASHFGPTVLVVTTSFLLALSQYSAMDAARIATAIFAGQLVIGWSNDYLDFGLDSAAHRFKKPLVSGEVEIQALKIGIPIAFIAAIALSLLSPLGGIGTLIHLIGLFSALAYNLRLKSTVLSPLPYAISFGALPWAVYLSNGVHPPTWLYLDFIFFTVAFHFLNVLKDLTWDIEQGVLGLPQRIGRKKSVAVASALIFLGVLDIFYLR